MLGVCSEFERIAKVVIDKAEKDNSMRRKRKGPDTSSSSTTAAKAATTPASKSGASASVQQTSRPTTANSATPQPNHAHANEHLSPSMRHEDHVSRQASYSPMAEPMSHDASPAMDHTGWSNDGAGDGNAGGMDGNNFPSFADLTGFGNIGGLNGFHDGPAGLQSPPSGTNGPFTQPVLPPDVFTLPMTLDWDWAEMSGGAYPSVENGNFGDVPQE